MKLSLPAPSPDQTVFQEMLNRGLERYPARKANYLKYKNSRRDSVIVDYLPVKMDYEVVSRCNFRCAMCRMSEWKGKRAEDMPFEDYKNSLDELYSLVEIKLQGVGEPLLHARIFDMIALAAERDIWTRLTTNGSLLQVNDNYKKLIDCNPGEVQISIDGASKTVFESIRQGANFEKIVESVTLLNEYAQIRGQLKTRSWTVVQQANLHELEAIVRLGQSMKFKRMTFCLALSNWGVEEWQKIITTLDASSQITQERAVKLIALGKELDIDVTFWYSSSKYKLQGASKQICPWLFERAFISSDMRIVPCCVFSSPDIADFGDARALLDNWNNEKYRELRGQHLQGDIPDFCKDCYE